MPDQLTNLEKTLQGPLTPAEVGGHAPDYDFGVMQGYQPTPSIEDLPNYNKLNRAERWFFNALPRVTQPLSDFDKKYLGGAGGAVLGFAGQLLTVLNIPADIVESGVGFAAQWLDASKNPNTLAEFNQHWGEAWSAGSLFAESANFPKIDPDKGIIIPNDFKGTEFLKEVRLRLAKGENIETLKEEYLNSLGALAYRAQVNDAWQHIIGDPLNIIPFIGPASKLEDLGDVARLAIRPVASIERIRDVLRAQRAFPGEIEKIVASVTTKIDEISKLEKTTENVAELERLHSVMDFAKNGLRELSPAEQRFLRFTGGIPGTVEKQRAFPFNLFKPSPATNAIDFQNQMVDNMVSHLFKDGDPEEWARAISRIRDGTVGREYGHMVVTPEGRHLRGFAELTDAAMQQRLAFWRATPNERELLNIVSNTLGIPDHDVLKLLAKEEEIPALFSRFSEKLQQAGGGKILDDWLLRNGFDRFSGDAMAQVLGIFKGEGAIYNKQLFAFHTMNDILDVSAKTALSVYGVKAAGALEHWSNTLKSAESLAFLRLNPTYPFRNLINNVVTMASRGALGNLTEASVKKFETLFGDILPARYAVGFGPAELETVAGAVGAGGAGSKAFSEAASTINSFVRGEKGALGRVENMIRNVKIGPNGKWDFGYLASRIEQWSSKRAFITGYLKHWPSVWGKSFTKIADFNPAAAEELGDRAGILEGKLRDVYNADQLRSVFRGEAGALNHSFNRAVDETSKLLGRDITHSIGAEELAAIQDDLIEALPKGEGAVREVFQQAAQRIEKHIQALADESVAMEVDRAASLGRAEGPGALSKIYSDVVDDFYASADHHAAEMSRLTDSLLQSEGGVEYWKALRARTGRYWDRFWTRQDGRFDGLAQAAKRIEEETGQRLPGADSLATNYKNLRETSKSFFEMRASLWDEYAEAMAAKLPPPLTREEIYTKLDSEYEKLIGIEKATGDEIDKLLIGMQPQERQPLYAAIRSYVGGIREADRRAMADFRVSARELKGQDLEKAWEKQWGLRRANLLQMYLAEQSGKAALGGNKGAQAIFANLIEKMSAEQLAQKNALITDLTKLFGANEEDVLQAVNKELNTSFKTIDEIPYEAARAVASKGATGQPDAAALAELDKRATELARQLPADAQNYSNYHLDDLDRVLGKTGDNMPFAPGLDQLLLNRAGPALDQLQNSAIRMSKESPLLWNDLAPATQQVLRGYQEHLLGQLGEARFAATKLGEWTRDSALLNYYRRMNYNNYLGVGVPYEFWVTNTIFKWGLHSIDHPFAAMTYLRMKKLFETAGAPEVGFPQRLKDTLRIPLPWLPKYLGDSIFVNPLAALLPLDLFINPLDQALSQNNRDQGSAARVLEELYNQGEIGQEAYNRALSTRTGPDWERALSLAQQDDSEERMNGFDFGSMLLRPHAPLMWAYNVSQGRPAESGPIFPISRSLSGIAGLLGIDLNHVPFLSIGGKVREFFGLPKFDQWADYRDDRMLANMVASGEISVSQMVVARRERDGNPDFEVAHKRAMKEYGLSALGSTIGIPLKSYPPGERQLRQLQDQYQAAWKAYEQGDLNALDKFNTAHPEYEARLGLFKSPDEQANIFLVDELWDKWNSLATIDRQSLVDRLGPDFESAFLNKETRSTANIPLEQLATWLKMIGGKVPGKLAVDAKPLKLAPPQVAQTAEAFYKYRKANFPTYYQLQSDYFDLKKGTARHDFLTNHPELLSYWRWHDDYLRRNPDIIPYVDDNFEPNYGSEAELRAAQGGQPNLTIDEWRGVLVGSYGGPALDVMVEQYLAGGGMNATLQDALEELARDMGLDYFDLLSRLQAAAQPSQ